MLAGSRRLPPTGHHVAVDLIYGIPALAALLVALAYVRRIAQRKRKPRVRRANKPLKYMRSLSQRSEMRAGDDFNSVMEDMQRTRSMPLSTHPSGTPSPNEGEGKSTRARRV